MLNKTDSWRDHLQRYARDGVALFDDDFLERWGDLEWAPICTDRTAAGLFHIELVSRVATQQLGYADGVEASALKSVYDLFGRGRAICETHVEAIHFEPMLWHVLNRHVRAFTAKWHRRSTSPAFSALDATDEFRAELTVLQRFLVLFDELCLELRDGKPPPPAISSEAESPLTDEMATRVAWGIDTGPNAAEINDAERAAIKLRREHYREFYAEGDLDNAFGMALSGGGIRSATFSLGVLISFAKRNLLPQVDYLSTVSGGGYLGAFLSTYLSGPATTKAEEAARAPEQPAAQPAAATQNIGLRRSELPFCETDREATAFGHIRQNCRYLLSGSAWSRLQVAFAQIYGLMVNMITVAAFVGAFALAEVFLRLSVSIEWDPAATLLLMGAAPLVVALGLLIVTRIAPRTSNVADGIFALSSVPLIVAALWIGLGRVHAALAPYYAQPELVILSLLAPAILAGLAILAGRVIKPLRFVFKLVAGLSVPLFLFAIYLCFHALFTHLPEGMPLWLPVAALGLLLLILTWALDVNFTGLHRHYRGKLACVFLLRHAGEEVETAEPKLSQLLSDSHAAPYPLINAALNVPSSKRPDMQGRLTDFFLFSPKYCGSPVLGYRKTEEWEAENSALDLATAMAISAAAASPQMGVNSPGRLSFWLALLNVRLGYWLAQPARKARIFGFGRPGLLCLLREMFGWMGERARHVNLSDGGHIENLGVYELLRRRCKYIVAIDGEEDSGMTFGALTSLQRMAGIDLGLKIDIDLDDLRLNDKGLSRSHFRFSRIRYRGGKIGYLLYLKLSLTGNEGEVLRRYKLDEPSFPHHSTLDQLFSEPQFEAYRSLGEHVGEKLFLKAIVGNPEKQNMVKVDDWFAAIGRSLLEPEGPMPINKRPLSES